MAFLEGSAARVSFNRVADTNAYTGGDVLGTATGSTAALNFSSIGNLNNEFMITSTSLLVGLSSVPSGMTSFTLHLYDGAPASAYGDNAAWDLPSGDRDAYLGSISLGTPVDVGSSLYVEGNGVNKQITVVSGLYGYLVTNAGYTPASGTNHVVTLHVLPV